MNFYNFVIFIWFYCNIKLFYVKIYSLSKISCLTVFIDFSKWIVFPCSVSRGCKAGLEVMLSLSKRCDLDLSVCCSALDTYSKNLISMR